MKIGRHPTGPLLLAGAAYVAAGGYVHLREWLDGYRSVPAEIPGAAVVKLGFPVTAAISVVLALALVALAVRRRRWSSAATIVAALSFAFEAVSLVTLVLSRTDSAFGWSEQAWTRGATQICAVEIGALAVLAGIAVLRTIERKRALA